MSGLAIAHDYVTQRGGAERVVLAMLRAFPDATLYTTVYNPETTFPEFRDFRIVTTSLDRSPLLRRDHRVGLPLYPHAVGSAPIIDADVLLCSTTGFAHGFRTTGRKLIYCHSPARFIYLADEYLGTSAWAGPTGVALRALHPYLRAWDQRAAASADVYLANSTVVARRIRDVYGIEATVVPAPPALNTGVAAESVAALVGEETGHHLIVSRLLPYKNVLQAIDAFRDLPAERLVIVGKGPLTEKIRRIAPANVTLLQGISDGHLAGLYQGAKALIAPSFEDYGLTPLEAGVFGTPTLALRAGGYLDTVREGVSGAFFEEPTAEAIRNAVMENHNRHWNKAVIRHHADQFAEPYFAAELHHQVDSLSAAIPMGV